MRYYSTIFCNACMCESLRDQDSPYVPAAKRGTCLNNRCPRYVPGIFGGKPWPTSKPNPVIGS